MVCRVYREKRFIVSSGSTLPEVYYVGKPCRHVLFVFLTHQKITVLHGSSYNVSSVLARWSNRTVKENINSNQTLVLDVEYQLHILQPITNE